MWKKSFEFLKDHLSPETVEKYGPSPPKSAATETGKTSADPPEPIAEGHSAVAKE
jgi:hypothetical protein